MAGKESLESLFKDLLGKLDSLKWDKDNFIFTSENLPVPPPYLETDELRVQKRTHFYDDYYRTDLLGFIASREFYGYLGLLTLAVMFHKEPAKVELKLTNPRSDIKNIIIEFEYEDLDNLGSGLATRPFAFKYYPAEISRHPWTGENLEPFELPCFWLTNPKQTNDPEADWLKRDTILGFGNDQASALIAELLLNLSHPENTTIEVDLESEPGFRGVARRSAEVKLELPWWYNED